MSGLLLLPPAPTGTDAGARNVRLLSVLRSLAVCGQLATILFVHLVLMIPLPLVPMIGAIGLLVALNLVIAQIAVRRPISDRALFGTLLVDVACLTVQLYLSGGLANPFVTLYLLQVVIAAVLLPSWASWTMAVMTSGLFAWLASSPFRLPADYGATISPAHTVGAWISFTLAAILLVLFVTRIMRNLTRREAHLAALRQRAVEEEHVVRMGLLASGAAHELGTPLASLAVTLGDWRRDPMIASAPELLAEVEAMSGEIVRCKDILSQILLAAGEVRGDAPQRTTLSRFIAATVSDWSDQRAIKADLIDHARDGRAIVADRPLAQTIVNLLDNAVEAGATSIAVSISLDEDVVTLVVSDDGRGFAPAILAEIGNPYRSTKLRHGAGLGLFLANNVLRTLGGTLHVRNKPDGGAEVELAWPIRSLAVAP
jgi:two-component system sensor histidine kinase RegB